MLNSFSTKFLPQCLTELEFIIHKIFNFHTLGSSFSFISVKYQKIQSSYNSHTELIETIFWNQLKGNTICYKSYTG